MTAPLAAGRIRPVDPSWLALAEPEDPLDPHIPIVDSHHHFYSPGRPHGVEYSLDDFRRDSSTGHNLVATVFASANFAFSKRGPAHLRSTNETEAAAGIGALTDSGDFGPTRVARGIIGSTDLTNDPGLVRESLDKHIELGAGRFRGIRDNGAYDHDPAVGLVFGDGYGRYLRPEFDRGVAELARRGLTLDAFVFSPQLADIVHLARRHPETSIVLAHTGCPLGSGRHAADVAGMTAYWRSAMAEIARCDNVVVKLGGMLMRLAAFDYERAERPITSAELASLWAPYITECLDLFGAERCLFESNYPVERMGVTYGALINTMQRLTVNGSESERRSVFAETAKRVYRLELDD